METQIINWTKLDKSSLRDHPPTIEEIYNLRMLLILQMFLVQMIVVFWQKLYQTYQKQPSHSQLDMRWTSLPHTVTWNCNWLMEAEKLLPWFQTWRFPIRASFTLSQTVNVLPWDLCLPYALNFLLKATKKVKFSLSVSHVWF